VLVLPKICVLQEIELKMSRENLISELLLKIGLCECIRI